MTRDAVQQIIYRGARWSLGPLTRSADGHLFAYGAMLDDDGEPVADGGFPLGHSFYIGKEVV